MAGTFRTEKETEYWLESETRSVRMPDGSMRPITDFRVLWQNVEFLAKASIATEEELVELAIMSSRETGRSFEESFPNVVAYVMRHATKQLYGE